ncbi:MAG: hypothetical protein K5695_17335 [Oscillospiraceae bacterium]|nr:hypothetical protein [Oscillospiraceae bacterium]
MRDPKEKKTKPITMKVTEEQDQQLRKQAAEQGVSVSNYISTKVFHSESQLTPEMVVCMQNIAEHANALLETGDSEYADLIRTEVKDLWSWLK